MICFDLLLTFRMFPGLVGGVSDSNTHTHTLTHLPTARTVTSPLWLRLCSPFRPDGLLIRGHFFWLHRVQMFLCPPMPPMVCKWLQVCLAAPGGASGDTGVIGGEGVSTEEGVSGGLETDSEHPPVTAGPGVYVTGA